MVFTSCAQYARNSSHFELEPLEHEGGDLAMSDNPKVNSYLVITNSP